MDVIVQHAEADAQVVGSRRADFRGGEFRGAVDVADPAQRLVVQLEADVERRPRFPQDALPHLKVLAFDDALDLGGGLPTGAVVEQREALALDPAVDEPAVAVRIQRVVQRKAVLVLQRVEGCLLYTSPSPRDATLSRMPSSA